jgi:hypothetical protein
MLPELSSLKGYYLGEELNDALCLIKGTDVIGYILKINYLLWMLTKPSPTLESALCPSKALGSEANHGEYPLRFKNWLVQKRYSPNTIKTYTSALKVFLNHFSNRLPESLNDKDVEEFMLCRIVNAGLSHAYQNQMVNAVRLFLRPL